MPKRALLPVTVLHPIQSVTRRTGLSADVLRVWEKRYSAVTPVRSTNGRRLYSDEDIERLRLLVQCTRLGRSIGQIATLATPALRALVSDEGRAIPQPRTRARAEPAPPPPSPASDLLEACVEAIADFDAVALDLLLRRAIIALSADEFLDAVVVPLTDHLRIQVLDGSLRRSHAHLAHAVLRRVLDHIVATATAPLASRDLVVSSLGGHAHELDALVVAAAAAAHGWRVTYVGPGAAADDIAETLVQVGARVLVLSVGAAPGDRVIPRELRRLRALLPARADLLVAGETADVHRAVLAETNATPVVRLTELRERLRALHSGEPTIDHTRNRELSRPRTVPRRRSTVER